ncbi:hypothetical protein PHYBOEH_010157 [Phytophthora boehmeriae]|uniref:Nucleotide-diphospho-sugar transferase n=1 Tax=Phytophthora boehmeriae TaxID=109152 RepID=A0A8T1VSP8_9STRA|nr:hypothetical protein PHYBOEH_010157 [Phytophthora boehmeriae]
MAFITSRWLGRLFALSFVLNVLFLGDMWLGDDTSPNDVRLFRADSAQDLNIDASADRLAAPTNLIQVSELEGKGRNSTTPESNSTTPKSSSGEVGANSTEQTSTNMSADAMLAVFLNNDESSTLDIPHFTCLGWRQTGECSPDGPRESMSDASCDANISPGLSGHCLLRNDATGQEVRAMRVNCSTLHRDASFNCRQATDFARVALQIDVLIEAKQLERKTPHSAKPNNGVVMVMYPRLIESVYATIRLLRSYNCSLPVELWYLESEMGASPLNDSRVLQSLVQRYGPISLRGIADDKIGGFNSKIFAVAHSSFDQVLFLDADNAPVKDPTYLFSDPKFVETGAIFWPDFWHPSHTIFNVKAESLVWELVDTPFVNMFEQESAQLLIDRRRSAVAMEIVQFLALRKPDHLNALRLLYGDKDIFRMAWLKTKTPFHMIVTPPGAAGMKRANRFCGMTMVQYDTKGEVLFLHHNAKKLIERDGDGQSRVWTHLQSFVFPSHLSSVDADPEERFAFISTNYLVQIIGGGGSFPGFSLCYGDTSMESPHFQLTPWEKLPFHDLESRLSEFASDARNTTPK